MPDPGLLDRVSMKALLGGQQETREDGKASGVKPPPSGDPPFRALIVRPVFHRLHATFHSSFEEWFCFCTVEREIQE